jgi:hypothetical protein
MSSRYLDIGGPPPPHPYHDAGEIPAGFTGCISDQETADAIAFIHGHVAPSFQGALAELLAAAPSLRVRATVLPLLVVPRLLSASSVTITGDDPELSPFLPPAWVRPRTIVRCRPSGAGEAHGL